MIRMEECPFCANMTERGTIMKNTLYGIGLDIGVASVGWAVVGLNGTGEPVGLHRLCEYSCRMRNPERQGLKDLKRLEMA